jgi:signal transduction histidine kinase
MVVQTGAARHSLRSDPDVAAESLLAAEQTGREALAEMRRLVGLMREHDAPLAPAPGLDAVPVLVERFLATGLPVRLDVERGMPDLAAGVDLAAYRVVQEGLTNALKHAGHVDTHVEIERRHGTLQIAIRTAGGPPIEGAEGADHGLVGLRERVALYRGGLEAGRQPDGSFLLRAAIPMEGS